MNKTIGVASTIAMLAMTAAFFFLPRTTMGQTPVELGAVQWNRDIENAKAVSARTGKPLFIQFQEVPG